MRYRALYCSSIVAVHARHSSVRYGLVNGSTVDAGYMVYELLAPPCSSDSHSRGLFAGLSLEGGMIVSRPDVNRKFYGREVSVR